MGRKVTIKFDPDGHWQDGHWQGAYVAILVLPHGTELSAVAQTEDDAVKKLRVVYEEWLWIREQEPLFPKTVDVDW